jgi:hypothetical protein
MRHLAHSPASGACTRAVTSTPSLTSSSCRSSCSSVPAGMRASPVPSAAGAGTARLTELAEPAASAATLKTSGPRGSGRREFFDFACGMAARVVRYRAAQLTGQLIKPQLPAPQTRQRPGRRPRSRVVLQDRRLEGRAVAVLPRHRLPAWRSPPTSRRSALPRRRASRAPPPCRWRQRSPRLRRAGCCWRPGPPMPPSLTARQRA